MYVCNYNIPMYMQKYTRNHVSKCNHTYIYICIYIYMCVCVSICIYTFIYIYTYVYVLALVHVVITRVYIYMWLFIHVIVCVYMMIDAYVYDTVCIYNTLVSLFHQRSWEVLGRWGEKRRVCRTQTPPWTLGNVELTEFLWPWMLLWVKWTGFMFKLGLKP